MLSPCVIFELMMDADYTSHFVVIIGNTSCSELATQEWNELAIAGMCSDEPYIIRESQSQAPS